MTKSVMVNVLVQVVVEVDADSDYGAKEIAQDEITLVIDQALSGYYEYGIIQNNVIWVTDKENMS